VDAGGGEFNLMPFHITVKMDPRHVDRLLVAFRNSPVPLEVQQVRINPEHVYSGGASSYARPMGPPTMGGGSREEGEHGPPMMGPGRIAGPGQPFGQPQQQQQQQRAVTVDIRGVAYLINPPPDAEKLHIASAANPAGGDAGTQPTGNATAGGATTATAPAASAPGGSPAPAEGATPAAAGNNTTTPAGTKTPPAGATPPAGTETPPPAGTNTQ
jgi:hypothetical protein